MAEEKRKYKVKVHGEEFEVDEDELIKGYQLQADYTRDKQRLEEEKKQWEAKLKESEERLKRLEEENRQWNEWWETTGKYQFSQSQNPYLSYSTGYENPSQEEIDEAVRRYVEERIEAEKEALKNEISRINQNINKTQRWIRYINDLNELYFEHHLPNYKDLPFRYRDIQEVALKHKNPDLSWDDWVRYWNEAYQEDLTKMKVEQKLQEEKQALEEKLKAQKVELGSGTPSTTGRIFKLPEEVPETMTEAEEGALQILREEKARRGE